MRVRRDARDGVRHFVRMCRCVERERRIECSARVSRWPIVYVCPGPVLRSSVTSGRDLRCFGHAKQVSCVVVESVFRVFVTQKHLIQL